MRKKLFAVIMSAMMMITFMPSMAFAAWVDHTNTHDNARLDNIHYSADYSTVYAEVKCTGDGSDLCNGFSYGEVSATTDREFDESTGAVDVSANSALEAAAKAKMKMVSPSITPDVEPFNANTAFFDLAGATIVGEATTQNADYFLNHASNPLGTKVKVVEPAYAKGYVATAPKSKELALTSGTDENGSFYYYDVSLVKQFRVDLTPGKYEAYEDSKDVEVGVEFKVYADQKVINAGKSTQKVSVNSDYVDFSHVVYTTKGGLNDGSDPVDNLSYGSSVSTAATNDLFTDYAGEDQAFGTATKGITVEYGTYDQLNNLTWSTKAPAMKDVKAGDYTYDFLVKVTRKTNTAYAKVSLDIVPVGLALRFKSDAFVFSAGEKVAVKDVVEGRVLNNYIGQSATYNDIWNTKAIFSADKKTAEAFINKFVTVDGIRTTVGKNKIYLAGDSIDFAAGYADPEFKQFALNYYYSPAVASYDYYILTAGGEEVAVAEADCQVVKGENYFKTNKKSIKVKRGKSATLKDKARFGTITYKKVSGNKKISVASNGKISVKKGLAKKTYKVKITERVNGTSQALALKRTKTIKVIVK